MHHLQHTLPVDPLRCDVWLEGSENSTPSLSAIAASTISLWSSCPGHAVQKVGLLVVIISMFLLTQPHHPPDHGDGFRGIDALVTEWRRISYRRVAIHEKLPARRELGGDPSHVVLQLTTNWAWQRSLEWFETVVAARQLDRSSHQSRC